MKNKKGFFNNMTSKEVDNIIKKLDNFGYDNLSKDFFYIIRNEDYDRGCKNLKNIVKLDENSKRFSYWR